MRGRQVLDDCMALVRKVGIIELDSVGCLVLQGRPFWLVTPQRQCRTLAAAVIRRRTSDSYPPTVPRIDARNSRNPSLAGEAGWGVYCARSIQLSPTPYRWCPGEGLELDAPKYRTEGPVRG